MKIEIWSDIVCPWCGLANYRLDEALARFDHRDQVEVVHRSFVMAPDLPERITQRELLRRVGKVGQAAEDYIRPIERLAKRDGLQPYEVMDRDMGNTELIHEFLAFAADHGGNTVAWRRAFRDHFGKGRTLFSVDSVVGFAAELGFDGAEVRRALTERRYRDRVRQDHQAALRLGAGGVPFTVVDDRYGLYGAQEIDTFLRAIKQAWDES
ncbi:Predicted dithiol-disulfide isomerase, DsbA family [Asanoa hainanensis]|uniref:Predicted dithiol-disulfide isomerase, DsbA family n=1 Tax=Asanoa hainanensis TaxID=560556 RepID=A0A239P2K7_9ACTN|nr:DsbA family oxidoreductase [Asanoa hainanensis]SNT60569.1 Predicted dithiol-disulfide isomerase, DsbA family [Asanoa hainanensis]